MNGRSYDERAQRRKARTRTGASSVRVTKATKQLIKELMRVIPPSELRSEDELIHELVLAELERRRGPADDPAQLQLPSTVPADK